MESDEVYGVCAGCKHADYWHYGAFVCDVKREMVDPFETCESYEEKNESNALL